MQSVVLIYDLGRTHKKVLIFDQDYKVVEESTTAIPDIKDEDGDPCEDLHTIAKWLRAQLHAILQNKDYDIKGINFSSHGASLVHLDKSGHPAAPLYDYMKPLNEEVSKSFYAQFGGKTAFSVATGSPALNMLNSGIQLYWLKRYKPDCFKKITTSLHLPQFGNHLLSGKKHADITSIGCHTGLWDFEKQQYHQWLQDEEVGTLLPRAEPVRTFDQVDFGNKKIPVGIGIHDSSSALLPFIKAAAEPFVLLSTGTWNITLNPFFKGNLDRRKYRQDCLYYLLDINRKVAASRLFLGNEYDHQTKKLEGYFNKQKGYAGNILPEKKLFDEVLKPSFSNAIFYPEKMSGTGPFPDLKGTSPDLSQFSSIEAAYHKLMLDLSYLQKVSIELVCGNIKRLYIGGGFLKNKVFMEALQAFLPDWKLFRAENERAAALGAAVALHEVWQNEPLSVSVSPVVPFKKKWDFDVSRYNSYEL